MLFQPGGNIVPGQLPTPYPGIITQIMIEINEIPVLLGESIYALLIGSGNPVSWEISLVVNEQCGHG